MLASLLTVGAAMQAQFLPGTYGPCGDSANWNNGTDGRNFFLVANATGSYASEDSPSSPNGICQGFMTNWVMSIVILCVVLGLLLLLPRQADSSEH